MSFRVDDLAEAVEFYVTHLGCEPVPRPDLGFPGAWLQAGETQVHLIEHAAGHSTGAPPGELTGIANHVAFRVSDLDEAQSHLESLGYPVQRGTQLQQHFVQDPTGNVIELTPTR